jgi:hypothetical protein
MWRFDVLLDVLARKLCSCYLIRFMWSVFVELEV